jgi:DNA-binding transcriptional LysR family regulator
MDIKPGHLLYLAAIGEHGSFVRAAEHLNISQPALSLSIQRVEHLTRTKLVERGRNGARLTVAGKLLARRGCEIRGAIAAAAEEIDLLAHGISGRLRVGGTPLSANSFIPEVIGRILQITHDVSITVIEGIDEDLLELLSRNELDIVIGAPGPVSNRSAFDTTPLFASKTLLVVRSDHPLASQHSVSLADLENALWAIPPEGGAFRKQIEALFTAYGIAFPEKTVQASSIHVITRIIQLSDAVTLAADHIVRDEVALGRLRCIEIPEPAALRIFSIHTKADSELGNLGALFCELALSLAPAYDKRVDAPTPAL